MTELAWHYLLFVFLTFCGILQIAAAYGKLNGVMFFKKPLAAYIFGDLVIFGAYLWFFLSGDRSSPPILEGPEKVGWAVLGGILALLFTILVSSLVKIRLRGSGEKAEETDPGLDALKRMTYFQAIGHFFKGRG